MSTPTDAEHAADVEAGERRALAMHDAERFADWLNIEQGHDIDWVSTVVYRHDSPVRLRANELVARMRDHDTDSSYFRESAHESRIDADDLVEFDPHNPEHHSVVLGVAKATPLCRYDAYVLRTARDLPEWRNHLRAIGPCGGRFCELRLPQGCNSLTAASAHKTKPVFVARGVFVVAVEVCGHCRKELGREFVAARLSEYRESDRGL
ncbi:hypothetical protein [Mycobacteroides saopaulense]|nr:hypothetical protein [Mycobacteroides saopaulense]